MTGDSFTSTNNGGTVGVQGHNSGEVSQTIGRPIPDALSQAGPPQDGWDRVQDAVPSQADRDLARKVFVVHGRDEDVRTRMFGLLRQLDLWPLEWEELVAQTRQASPFLGDVVGLAPSRAQAAVVLLTPEDIVMLHADLRRQREDYFETRPMCQPRPNVLIELGMVLGAYPDRTLLLQFGDLRPIADYLGRNLIHFDGSAGAVGKVVERLKTAGCAVNDRGTDWRAPWPRLAAQERRP